MQHSIDTPHEFLRICKLWTTCGCRVTLHSTGLSKISSKISTFYRKNVIRLECLTPCMHGGSFLGIFFFQSGKHESTVDLLQLIRQELLTHCLESPEIQCLESCLLATLGKRIKTQSFSRSEDWKGTPNTVLNFLVFTETSFCSGLGLCITAGKT